MCGSHVPFDFPESLLEAFQARKVVVFAGAGISTESRKVYPHTLHDEALDEAGTIARDVDLSFPAAMSAVVARRGKPRLLRMIQRRLDYVSSFPELELLATEFHEELGTIRFIEEIVTTNWDTYFEDRARCVPFVVPSDYAFWDFPGRKVFKIHGSITNLGTIVATEDDYQRSAEALRSGVIGSTLKHLLATKVAVFVGYSWRDED